MRHARVLVGARGTQAEQKGAIKALEHAANFIRHEIIERLQLRRVPELHFSLDNSQEYTERIDQILKEMKKGSPPTS
jgi:ribosome-binding factor A